MNYELAKELMQAGFPAKLVSKNQTEHWFGVSSNETYSFPTLEELIEVCGNQFWSIKRSPHPVLIAEGKQWLAEYREIAAYGPTASEAVGNLWLALNKDPKHPVNNAQSTE